MNVPNDHHSGETDVQVSRKQSSWESFHDTSLLYHQETGYNLLLLLFHEESAKNSHTLCEAWIASSELQLVVIGGNLIFHLIQRLAQ